MAVDGNDRGYDRMQQDGNALIYVTRFGRSLFSFRAVVSESERGAGLRG